MRDIRNLETRTTINEKDIATINKQLEKNNLNITWILRIVISAIVMAVLGLILQGGIQVVHIKLFVKEGGNNVDRIDVVLKVVIATFGGKQY